MAAERVRAWHLARFRAHVQPPEPVTPPAPPPSQPDVVRPVVDPIVPGQPRPAPDPGAPERGARPH